METLLWVILIVVLCVHYYQCKKWEQLAFTLFEMEKRLGIRDQVGNRVSSGDDYEY